MEIAHSADAIAELENEVAGPVLFPGTDEYERERAGFDLSADHHPDFIVGATRVADVQAAVRFAARYGMPIAVHSTGHGAAQPAHGGLMISVRRMDEVRIAPLTPAARIDAGVRWRKVIDEAAPYGLAPPSGSTSQVGAVSYALGGGLSVIGRTHGYAADHVLRIEVVTADGRLRRVSADRNADLFWALRGGKGNFGVVTSMEMGLLPVSRLYGGGLYLPGEAAGPALHAWREWTRTVPDSMNSSVALLRAPDAPFVPEPLRGRFVVHLRIAYLGSAAAGERLVEPLRRVASPIIDTLGDMPFTAIDEVHQDPTDPLPLRHRTTMLGSLDHQAVEALLAAAGPDADFPVTMVELRHLGGALARPPREAGSVSNRDAEFTLLAAAVAAPGADDAITGHMDRLLDGMGPWSTGGRFLNFLIGPGAADEVRDCYPPAVYKRLAAIKAVYDPANLFRVNHNIPPVPAALHTVEGHPA